MTENTAKEMSMEMTYCGDDYFDEATTNQKGCDAADGACPSCLRAHIAKLEAALADARQCLSMFTDAPVAEADVGEMVPPRLA